MWMYWDNGTNDRARSEQNRIFLPYELLVAGFEPLALLAVEWLLVSVVHGTNYDGGDGKMAQATILAAIKFGAPFHVTNISPIEGLGSQLLPINVWGNPAYWPFTFSTRRWRRASPRSSRSPASRLAVTSWRGVFFRITSPQLCIVLFAAMVLILDLPTVFWVTPGKAVPMHRT
jgi:hypothetical protein